MKEECPLKCNCIAVHFAPYFERHVVVLFTDLFATDTLCMYSRHPNCVHIKDTISICRKKKIKQRGKSRPRSWWHGLTNVLHTLG